jgi:hypothetical protein
MFAFVCDFMIHVGFEVDTIDAMNTALVAHVALTLITQPRFDVRVAVCSADWQGQNGLPSSIRYPVRVAFARNDT